VELRSVTVQSAREGTEGGKRRHKQCPQGVTTTTDYDNTNNGMAGGAGKGRVMTVVHSDKCQACLPSKHFKRLLEEACANHVYPIRHKLKNCDMMKSFMISGSPTWGMELDEDPNRSDTMPFPKEKKIVVVYGGCPPPPPRQGGVTCLS
jgi:hypothetical protein